MTMERTVTFTVEVTQIVKDIETEFLMTEYKGVIEDKLRNKMEFDNVQIRDYKVFETENDK